MADSASLTSPGDASPQARLEVLRHPHLGDLWCGPSPVVRGSGLDPLKEIRVEVRCRDGKGQLWKSDNQYLVSDEGVFDTSQTSSVGPGYYGIDPEGPFYSMYCQEQGEGCDFVLRDLSSIEYQIACYDGSEQLFQTELVRTVGRAQPPSAATARIYLLDDSPEEGWHAEAALAACGFEVSRQDPRHPPNGPPLPSAIVASGRASARALELAIRCPEIQAVVLFSGSGLRFDPFEDAPGQAPTDASTHIALDHSSLRPRAEGILITRKLYADAVANKSNRELGRIEVEKIACPIHLFSGLDDQIWPASAFSELVVQRRKKAGCPYPTYHRTFEGVGHDLGPSLGLPTLPTTERTVAHPETGFRLLLGGRPGRQSRARRECWDSLLTILAGQPPRE
jgi:hypothetical protein